MQMDPKVNHVHSELSSLATVIGQELKGETGSREPFVLLCFKSRLDSAHCQAIYLLSLSLERVTHRTKLK